MCSVVFFFCTMFAFFNTCREIRILHQENDIFTNIHDAVMIMMIIMMIIMMRGRTFMA